MMRLYAGGTKKRMPERFPVSRFFAPATADWHNFDRAQPAPKIAVIDGPYDAAALARIFGRPPINFGDQSCAAPPNGACHHGTFIMGLLGAREDAQLPGFCDHCELVHIPLFNDRRSPEATVAELTGAIVRALGAGAKLINLSLAILGDDAEYHADLAEALDQAESYGAIVVAAAGNEGRLATGQIISHPVTIPVVAVDASGQLLPECNFGPAIADRGVAVLGQGVAGYAPGGKKTKMSGSSVATAIATRILAQVWSMRSDLDGAAIRAAVVRLAPRHGRVPPTLSRDALLGVLDRPDAAIPVTASGIDSCYSVKCAESQGGAAMDDGNRQQRNLNRSVSPAAMSASAVTLAQGTDGCSCGAPNGQCNCRNAESSPTNFVYVLGTLDVHFPDQSISDEMQNVARTIGVRKHIDEPKKHKKDCMDQGQNEEVRSWCYRVLSDPDHGRQARYVARQLCWILRVEGQPAYYITLRDLHDLDDLITCLGEPKGGDLCLLVGSSSLIPVEACPGVTAPTLLVDYLCSFDQRNLLKGFDTSTPKPGAPTSKELFAKFVQSADNFGDTDELRALNYLAVRYAPLYDLCRDMLHDPTPGSNYVLHSFKVVRSRLWGEKRIVDPVFAFRDTVTGDIRKYFVRVDVSHLFPMIANDIAEYFDR